MSRGPSDEAPGSPAPPPLTSPSPPTPPSPAPPSSASHPGPDESENRELRDGQALPPAEPFRPVWSKVVPYVLMHAGAVWALVTIPPTPSLVGLAFGLYLLRMFGVTAGYHRYFAHRSFKTSRAGQLVLALVANTSLMRGPLVWAAAHRHHHRFSDRPEDLHSPAQRGFLSSHTLWFLSQQYARTPLPEVRDLARFPELVWVDRFYPVPSYAIGVALAVLGGWPAFGWGFLVSTVFTWHAVFTINSLSHVFGTQRYRTGDTSRNNALLALLTLGEGWHNNHHFDMASARQGFFWWELDPTYVVLRVLAALGLIWDLRPPVAAAYALPSPGSGATSPGAGAAGGPSPGPAAAS